MTTATQKPIQIGALAKLLGISTRTIRYYEEIGLMGASPRIGGARSYHRDEVLRLKFILKMKELGLTLKEMQELAHHFDASHQDFKTITPQLLEILDQHIAKVDEKLASLAVLRQDIVAYRGRIEAILRGQQPLVK